MGQKSPEWLENKIAYLKDRKKKIKANYGRNFRN